MAEYTRQQCITEQRKRMASLEALGRVGSQQSTTSNQMLTDIVEDICRRTDCYYYGGTSGPGAFVIDIVAGKPDYSASPLYKIDAVIIRDAVGNARPVSIMTPREMDQCVGTAWRSVSAGSVATSRGVPSFAILKGKNSFSLWPVPDYSSLVATVTDLVIGVVSNTATSAARPFTASDIGRSLTVIGGDGFTQSQYTVLSVAGVVATLSDSLGTAGSTDGVATISTGGIAVEGNGVPQPWPNPTDLIPLAADDHEAALYGLGMRRCEQLLGSDNPVVVAQASRIFPIWKNNYDEKVGRIESDVITQGQHGEPGGAIW